MKVLVAGATSVLGPPVILSLQAHGHDVVGLTRSTRRAVDIQSLGATAVVGEVMDADAIRALVADVAPDGVISLLTTLPKWGPKRVGDFKPAVRLWSRGVPGLLAAAHEAGVGRFVTESMVFAYGYHDFGTKPVTEDQPDLDAPPGRRGRFVLDAMHGMERLVLDADGIVLRYGIFHGRDVPHTRLISRLAKHRLLPIPGPGGTHPWIEIGDAAAATVAALERGVGGQIYNVTDNTPIGIADYVTALAAAQEAHPPWHVPMWLARFLPYPAIAFGRTHLPASNAKARRDLEWEPTHSDPREAITTFL